MFSDICFGIVFGSLFVFTFKSVFVMDRQVYGLILLSIQLLGMALKIAGY